MITMLSHSIPRLDVPPPPFNTLKLSGISPRFSSDSRALDGGLPAVSAFKSFAILAGYLCRVGQKQEMNEIQPGKAPAAPSAGFTERYAYYRRCRHFRSNGEQCKAPAMKGEAICNRHAEQLEFKRRRTEQRREFYSRAGLGLASPKAIQKTLNELAREIMIGRIDRKVIAGLFADLQIIMRLHKALRRWNSQKKSAAARVPVPHRSAQASPPVASKSSSLVGLPGASKSAHTPVSDQAFRNTKGLACARPQSCRNVMANALHGPYLLPFLVSAACNRQREAPRFPPWCSRKASDRSRTGLRGCWHVGRAGSGAGGRDRRGRRRHLQARA